ncbi:MAG: hypothetical protein ACR2FG_02320, partial [Marmoricola sp.]
LLGQGFAELIEHLPVDELPRHGRVRSPCWNWTHDSPLRWVVSTPVAAQPARPADRTQRTRADIVDAAGTGRRRQGA